MKYMTMEDQDNIIDLANTLHDLIHLRRKYEGKLNTIWRKHNKEIETLARKQDKKVETLIRERDEKILTLIWEQDMKVETITCKYNGEAVKLLNRKDFRLKLMAVNKFFSNLRLF